MLTQTTVNRTRDRWDILTALLSDAALCQTKPLLTALLPDAALCRTDTDALLTALCGPMTRPPAVWWGGRCPGVDRCRILPVQDEASDDVMETSDDVMEASDDVMERANITRASEAVGIGETMDDGRWAMGENDG